MEEDGLQGDLIKKHVPDDWDFEGMQEGQWANRPTAALHAEFEGGGVYNLMIACLAALPFAVAATVVCAIPVLGWIACAILGAIAAGIFLAGVIAGLTDTGDPNDVNPGLGEIHTNDPTGRGADILVVRGTRVYDSAHEGWNEIHPILHCQRIGTWGGSWSSTEFAPPSTVDSVKRWCEKVTQAEDPATTTAQLRPESQWEVHPVVDGCTGSAGSGTPPNLH